MNIRNKSSLIFFVFIAMSMLLVQSCLQTPTNSRKSSISLAATTTTPKTTKLPTFTPGNNFIQNGGMVFTSSVNFDLSFADTMQLRGKEIDNYIRITGMQTIPCLTGQFTNSTVNKIIIFAAMPHSIYNFTTQTLEYFYNISPADEASNKNFCQKTGLSNKLFDLYPALTPIYKVNALCSGVTCVSSTYSSSPLEMYDQNGSLLSQMTTKQLTYTITNRPDLSLPSGQETCVGSNECIGRGYDCCSEGICVKDLALKPGVDKSSQNYIQALQDILNNPNHIYLYSQYYFICTNPSTTPSNPSTPGYPTSEAAARVQMLKDLYNCTTKLEGEMGICTITQTNAVIGTTYNAGRDDRNFSFTYTNQATASYTPAEKGDLSSIQEVSYGGIVLFNYTQMSSETISRPDPLILPLSTPHYLSITGLHNDNTSSGASIQIVTLPPYTVSSDLVIRYRVDASCTQMNTNLGKCEKYYIQGQQKSGDTLAQNITGRVTDHFPASNIFKLPDYANVDKLITVEVDGIKMQESSDWKLNKTSPATIEFLSPSTSSSGGLTVLDSQKVKITFFVDLLTNHVMDSKLEALKKIQANCHCADLNCSLRPVTNLANVISDYICIYPDPNPIDPPISQTIYLSSKAVPVRYFDANGVSKASLGGDTVLQEGKAFSYRKDNLLNPSNVPDIVTPVVGEDTYVGFNEIYGSITYDSNSAKPAKEISVAKGKMYDIYVDNGSYSNCLLCGNDYYSQLNKLFPLTQFGGGLVPLQSSTSRTITNGIRADDMSFGRACLVPATMIPWSHSIASDATEQRKNRMRAQHFFYANGYQRDWFGFDYGSVIGSFDGVKWFSIGTNRRIKADTNKLFIAINGLFGDLTLEETFTVTINDAALNPVGTNMVTTDMDSDGAQCQKFHQCSTDNDCATTLGWNYICSNMSETTSSWPVFDDNAKELPDTQVADNRLSVILKPYSIGKRCIYRGRGAACTQNYLESSLSTSSTFNQAAVQSQHTCSDNNYCQSLITAGILSPKFNNRIARYGRVRIDSTSDSFGLAAKVPGRPMEFNAIEPIRSETIKNFNSNNVRGMCIPGRNPELNTFILQHSTIPAGTDYNGDKILGIGMSYADKNNANKNYLASCSIMNDTNDYFYAKDTPTSSNNTNTSLIYNSGTQAISTNALQIFKAPLESKGISFNLLTNNSAILTTPTFMENRCLRAPGASCFSDLDCAPSKLITDKINMLRSSESAVAAVINADEIKFWQEELTCSQATAKTDASYSSFNNRCCRDLGKTISIANSNATNKLKNYLNQAAGIDISISNQYRYSRLATVYRDQQTDPTNYPPLVVAVSDQCSIGCLNTSTLTNQFKTFSAYAERTSCTGDWVRNFNNGNHQWNSSRLQTFNPLMFRCMNWLPGIQTTSAGISTKWSCAGLDQGDPQCRIIQTPSSSMKAKGIMTFLGKLELTGIPQIAVESDEFFNTTTEGDLSCKSDPNDQNATYPGHPTLPLANYTYPTQIFSVGASKEYVDASTKKLFSASDSTNFQSPLSKMIFKSDEVATCLAAGTDMKTETDANLCCTGFIDMTTHKCKLPDFVDLSVYTNRYVSSEAKKLNVSLFDVNGYIRDPSYVAQLACQRGMCASGVVAYGVLISNLKTPGQEDLGPEFNYFRFLEGSSLADDENGFLTLFNQGLKLNTHAYCFPNSTTPTTTPTTTPANPPGLTKITCGN